MEDKIEELLRIADEYDQERKKGFMHSHINKYEYMDMYLKWYKDARILFAEFFPDSDEMYYEFKSYSTAGNGITLANNFTRQYPLFKHLIERIRIGEPDKITTKSSKMTKKCFLVHGRNESWKMKVARFIEKEIDITTIILHEQPNRGKTIIEKFEAYGAVDFAVALWIADDEGRLIGESDLKPRPRQNVIFETGFFIGHLGRDKVIVLGEPGVVIPSDYNGII